MGVSQLNGRLPAIFDSADVGGTIAAIPYTWTTQQIAAGVIQWTAVASGQGDQVIIQDVNGKEIWRSQPATGPNFSDEEKFPDTEFWFGFVIAQFPSGVIALHPR